MTPNFSKSIHNRDNLLWASSVTGIEPLCQLILSCRLFLQASIPVKSSFFGIEIAILSPFKHSCGSWERGVLQTFETASAKVFCGFSVSFSISFDCFDLSRSP